MHIQKAIEELGYGRNEAKTYLASLGLGAATVTDIAQKARIPRTTCQHSIEILEHDGLMGSYTMRRRKYWIAENPDKFLLNLKEREVVLQDILPELKALRHETGVRPTIRSYHGIDGIKAILSDIITSHQNLMSLTSLEDARRLLGDEFRDFVEHRYKSNMRVRFLTKKSPDTIAMKARDTSELRTTRFLPDDFVICNANYIYGNKVAIISLNKKLPIGIIIEDQDIAEMQRALFEMAWAASTF